MHSLVIGFAACILSVLAAPASVNSYALKERHAVPSGWTVVARAPQEHVVQLAIGLRQPKPRHARAACTGSVYSWLFTVRQASDCYGGPRPGRPTS